MKLKPYPKYKDSGIKWIGEIPEGWRIEKLKRFVYFQEGPGLRNWQFSEDGMKVLTVTNITRKGIIWEKNELFISDEEYKTTYKHFSLEKNDIVFASSGASWGKSTIVKEKDLPAILNTSTIRCHALKSSKLNHKYLRLFVDSDIFTESILQLITGSCQPNFGPSHLNQIAIILPPEIQQMAIEKYLNTKNSEINQIIEKDKRLIELLKEKRNALINHAVTKGLDPNVKLKDSGIEWIGEIPEGWEVRKLKQVTSIMISNVDKKSKPDEEEVLLCNYNEVYNNEFVTLDLGFMKATASIEQINKFSIKKEDVIITKDSETPEDIAVPSLVEENLNNIVCGYHLALIRPNRRKIKGKFLLRMFQSKKINDQFVISANGVTRFGISTYPIKNSFVIVPPLHEQTTIANFLDQATSKMDKTIQKIEQKINLLEEYKKSLIHHVVTGKVDVRKSEV